MHRRHGQREITSARWQPVAAGIPSEPRCCTLPGNLSLACVEVLVHLDKSELPRDYVLFLACYSQLYAVGGHSNEGRGLYLRFPQ